MSLDIYTVAGMSGSGSIIAWKIGEFFFMKRKEKKAFDETLRSELWDRVKNLEGRIDEQNKMILEVMRENAELKFENKTLVKEIEALKASA